MISEKETHRGPEKLTGDNSLLTINENLKIPQKGNTCSSVKSFLDHRMISINVTSPILSLGSMKAEI